MNSLVQIIWNIRLSFAGSTLNWFFTTTRNKAGSGSDYFDWKHALTFCAVSIHLTEGITVIKPQKAGKKMEERQRPPTHLQAGCIHNFDLTVFYLYLCKYEEYVKKFSITKIHYALPFYVVKNSKHLLCFFSVNFLCFLRRYTESLCSHSIRSVIHFWSERPRPTRPWSFQRRIETKLCQDPETTPGASCRLWKDSYPCNYRLVFCIIETLWATVFPHSCPANLGCFCAPDFCIFFSVAAGVFLPPNLPAFLR